MPIPARSVRPGRLRAVLIAAALASPLLAAQAPPTIADARALLPADPAAAAALLTRITARTPDDPTAWRLLATAHQRAEAFDAALAAWQRLLALTPDDPRAMYGVGVALKRTGEIDAAFEWLDKARDTKRLDMSQLTTDASFADVVDDPRLRALLPTAADFDDPFVEPVTILGEWRGEAAGDQFGWIARAIGDVDGDGASDFVTSAPTKAIGGANAGRVYVYSSKTRDLLWSADGEPGDRLGQGVEAAGDVNRDGIPDVVASAIGRGRVYVYAGDDGRVLHTFTSGQVNERYGQHVSAGDLNGDGYSDVLVGAPGAPPATPAERATTPGRVLAYSGRDGRVLAEWRGERPGDQFGSTVAGDPRGDASLVVVGAPTAGDRSTGRAYVYDGVALEPAFTMDGDAGSAALGAMFAAVPGDVDGDDVPDVYVSDWAHGARGPQTGRVHVHSGRTGAPIHVWTGETAGEGFGTSASNAGDVDGDGHADFIVGAWQYGEAAVSGGRAYLYSGRDGRLVRTYTCRTPGDTFGFDAVGIGDVDGDGTVDLLITSAWSAVSGNRSGRVFIIASGIVDNR